MIESTHTILNSDHIRKVYVKQSHKFRDFRTGCARSSELSGQKGILLAHKFNGAAHLCRVKASSTSPTTGFTTPAVKHNACSKRSVCVSWACAYTERLFSRKQRARTSGLSTVVHESTASARYHIDFRAPGRRAPETDTRTGPCVDPLQAVGEYYNNVDKFKNNRK